MRYNDNIVTVVSHRFTHTALYPPIVIKYYCTPLFSEIKRGGEVMRYNDNIVTVVSHRFSSLVVFGVT